MTTNTTPGPSVFPVEINKTSIPTLVQTIVNNLSVLNKLVLFYGATGVGKTTLLPYHLSTRLGTIHVLVDSQALKESLSHYMSKAKHVIYLTKLEYVLSPIQGYILIDESHQPDHLTQHLIRRMANPQNFFLTSATSDHFTADPKQTLHPVTDMFDDRYTLQALYLGSPLPFLSQKPSGFRTCVFVPNDRDATSLAKRYSGIPVFPVTTSNYAQQVPLIQSTKGPVLLFASPVMQTGVTLDLDVVIDLGLSNNVSFQEKSNISHINVTRVNSTFLERVQRRGRVGRLKRGIYVSANNSFSKNFSVHPYFQMLYDRLSSPITPKLRLQLSSIYHPLVTDPLIDSSGSIISYWKNSNSSNTQLPAKIQLAFDDGNWYHSTWWDHTVEPATIWAELLTPKS